MFLHFLFGNEWHSGFYLCLKLHARSDPSITGVGLLGSSLQKLVYSRATPPRVEDRYRHASSLIMDADLLDVGSQCSQNNCRQIDFLPLRCSCDLYFCRDHILPDAHTCRLLGTATPHSSDPAAKFQRCALAECSNASLDAFSAAEAKSAASCSHCHLAFCAE